MALRPGIPFPQRICRSERSVCSGGIVASAAKSSKGFGGARKHDEQKSKRDGMHNDDQRTFKEAAAVVTSHRPVKLEEAAKGKLDYVQVADWGDGDRSKLGELRLVSHVQQYEGGASNAPSGNTTSGASPGGSSGIRPFHLHLANQLKMAEARGALAVAGPPPPPVSEWSFREDRYRQYLTDQLEVHEALEAALLEATSRFPASNDLAAARAATASGVGHVEPATTNGVEGCSTGNSSSSNSAPTAGPEAPPRQPQLQGALHALRHLVPGRLGLERSAAIRQDLAALNATANHPAAVTTRLGGCAADFRDPTVGDGAAAAMASSAQPPVAAAVAAATTVTAASVDHQPSPSHRECTPGPMARSYAQVLRRLGRVAASGEVEQERESGGRRLLAHAAVLHMVAQASGVRLGATATERLALLQRRAAAAYHQYPPEVTEPRVTLSRALDAAGEHLLGPAARQEVYDEVAGAMQKTALLLSALAYRD